MNEFMITTPLPISQKHTTPEHTNFLLLKSKHKIIIKRITKTKIFFFFFFNKTALSDTSYIRSPLVIPHDQDRLIQPLINTVYVHQSRSTRGNVLEIHSQKETE